MRTYFFAASPKSFELIDISNLLQCRRRYFYAFFESFIHTIIYTIIYGYIRLSSNLCLRTRLIQQMLNLALSLHNPQLALAAPAPGTYNVSLIEDPGLGQTVAATLKITVGAQASSSETVRGYFEMSSLQGTFRMLPSHAQGIQDSSLISFSNPEQAARSFGIDPSTPPPSCEWIVEATIEIKNRQPNEPIGINKDYSADLVRVVTKSQPNSSCI